VTVCLLPFERCSRCRRWPLGREIRLLSSFRRIVSSRAPVSKCFMTAVYCSVGLGLRNSFRLLSALSSQPADDASNLKRRAQLQPTLMSRRRRLMEVTTDSLLTSQHHQRFVSSSFPFSFLLFPSKLHLLALRCYLF